MEQTYFSLNLFHLKFYKLRIIAAHCIFSKLLLITLANFCVQLLFKAAFKTGARNVKRPWIRRIY